MPVIFAVLVFLLPINVHAELLISEIMYDPPGADTGHEWLEVENTGDTAVDLSMYKLFENETHHALTVVRGNTFVSPHSFAVIVSNPEKFFSDWPMFTGTAFDSSWSSLSNSGEAIALTDAKGVKVASATYTSAHGGAGDGNSLAFQSAAFIKAKPTPGGPNDFNALALDTTATQTHASSQTTVSSHKKIKTVSSVQVATSTTASVTSNTSGTIPISEAASLDEAIKTYGTVPITYWILGLIGLILIGVGSMIWVRTEKNVTDSEADQFTIIE